MTLDAAVALITLAQAKTYLKISGSTEDDVLNEMINRSGQICASYVGRPLKTDTYTEYYDGDGGRYLQLRRFPLTELTSLHVDALRTWGADTAIDVSADVILDGPAGILTLWNNGGLFLCGVSNVRAVYKAGYKDTADNLVPYDLQEAALLILQHHYKRHYSDQRIGLVSETVGDRTFNYTNEDIPKTAAMILDSYKQQVRMFS